LSAPQLGFAPENIKFGSCSLESDKFLTVCETAQQSVAIVDLHQNFAISRQKMSAEAAVMNPVSKVVALRAGNVLQLFNLELRAKMKSHTAPQPVVYWKWIAPNAMALVTATAVFHWSIEGDAAPVKVFDRNPALTDGTQIINYQVSADGQWCLLCGISAGGTPGVINGTMQLYCIEKQTSQMLSGHSGVFTTVTPPGVIFFFCINAVEVVIIYLNLPYLFMSILERSRSCTSVGFLREEARRVCSKAVHYRSGPRQDRPWRGVPRRPAEHALHARRCE
jgi:clathrin heavy chain